MSDVTKDFVLKGKKLKYANDGDLPTIRVSSKAYNALVNMANESCLSISSIASQAVLYAQEHLRYDRSGEGNEG